MPLVLFAGLATGPVQALAPVEVRIPMKDGVKLAADLWKPEQGRGPFPVLLEYLPYRKTEARGDRFGLYAYFVRRGYVVARVDIRGTGNSEGVLIPYEYSDIEIQDGDAVIAWLARQPFSSGKVAMFGISGTLTGLLHSYLAGGAVALEAEADDDRDDLGRRFRPHRHVARLEVDRRPRCQRERDRGIEIEPDLREADGVAVEQQQAGVPRDRGGRFAAQIGEELVVLGDGNQRARGVEHREAEDLAGSPRDQHAVGLRGNAVETAGLEGGAVARAESGRPRDAAPAA